MGEGGEGGEGRDRYSELIHVSVLAGFSQSLIVPVSDARRAGARHDLYSVRCGAALRHRAVLPPAGDPLPVPRGRQRRVSVERHALSDDVLHGARPPPHGGAGRGRGAVHDLHDPPHK